MHKLEYDTGKIILCYYRNNNNNITPILTRQTVIWAARSNGHWSFDKIRTIKLQYSWRLASRHTIQKNICALSERENEWAKEYNIIIVYKIVYNTMSVSIRWSETKRFGTIYVYNIITPTMWKNGKEQNDLKFYNRFTCNMLEYNNCIKIRLNHSTNSI